MLSWQLWAPRPNHNCQLSPGMTLTLGETLPTLLVPFSWELSLTSLPALKNYPNRPITSSNGNPESLYPLLLHKSLPPTASAHLFCSQVQHLVTLHGVACSSPPEYELMWLMNCRQTLLSAWCLMFSHLQNPMVGLNASPMHEKDAD